MSSLLIYTITSTDEELESILRLQKANLPKALTAEEARSQGFVSVDHSFAQMKSLHKVAPHVIGKAGAQVVGYVLAMTAASKNEIPILVPMFELFETLRYHNGLLKDYRYMVVGQVCVDKAYRGLGVFDALYACYRQQYQNDYDFAITEIALSNTRSLQAHQRVGFRELHQYRAPDGTDWSVVLWDWK